MNNTSPPVAEIVLDGRSLTAHDLAKAARGRPKIDIHDDGLNRMLNSRKAVEAALGSDKPVYGLTTGLGSQSGAMLSEEERAEFPAHMVRGRAQSIGTLLPEPVVRAAMIQRINSFCLGNAGVRPEVALTLRDWLNAGLTPAVGSIGSIGASDLCQAADLALALIGEGHVLSETGTRTEALVAMKAVGLSPLKLAPKDGLPLIGHSGLTLGRMALAIADCRSLMTHMENAAALSLAAFGASPAAFDTRALRSSGLRHDVLAGQVLSEKFLGAHSGAAMQGRRLQDPLSLRHLPQLHGGLMLALEFADRVIDGMLNGSPDNPCVLPEDEEILSCGNYATVSLGISGETVARAVAPVATAIVARISKLLTSRFTELPQYLAVTGSGNNGFAPTMKIVEALNTEIQSRAQCRVAPLSLCADGIEDIGSTAPTVAQDLEAVVDLCFDLVAWEMTVSAAAVEARQAPRNACIATLLSEVREFVGPAGPDRPTGRSIERLSEEMRNKAISYEQR